MGEWSSIILDLGIRRGVKWSASCPGRFTPGERAPGTLGGLQSRSERCGEEKNPCRESNAVLPVRRYTGSWTVVVSRNEGPTTTIPNTTPWRESWRQFYQCPILTSYIPEMDLNVMIPSPSWSSTRPLRKRFPHQYLVWILYLTITTSWSAHRSLLDFNEMNAKRIEIMTIQEIIFRF
jgi:hypothetical protein